MYRYIFYINLLYFGDLQIRSRSDSESSWLLTWSCVHDLLQIIPVGIDVVMNFTMIRNSRSLPKCADQSSLLPDHPFQIVFHFFFLFWGLCVFDSWINVFMGNTCHPINAFVYQFCVDFICREAMINDIVLEFLDLFSSCWFSVSWWIFRKLYSRGDCKKGGDDVQSHFF